MEKVVPRGGIGSPVRRFNAHLHNRLCQFTYQWLTVSRQIPNVNLCVNEKSSGKRKDLLKVNLSSYLDMEAQGVAHAGDV